MSECEFVLGKAPLCKAGLVSLRRHPIRPPCCQKAYIRADHFNGGGSSWERGRTEFDDLVRYFVPSRVENEENVMLLQLVYDDMLGCRFGDMGAFHLDSAGRLEGGAGDV